MLKNYLTIAFRNLWKNKVYSFLNIGGLAVGMAVAMLIGLWMYDEFSYNRYHQNYDRIVRVMQPAIASTAISAWWSAQPESTFGMVCRWNASIAPSALMRVMM